MTDPHRASSPARRRTVLVDDTPDLRELLAMTLEETDDFQVVGEAGDGRAGIAVTQETEPDLVVLDLAMPVMDGLEALPHLRRIRPNATIVVLSGFGATAMRDQALVSGADGYVEKGTRLPAIVDRLRRIADESEARRGVAPGRDDVPAAASPTPAPAAAAPPPPDPATLLVEHAPVAMLVADHADGTVRFANGAATQMLGIAAGPLASLADLLPELWDAVGGRDPAEVAEESVRVQVVRDGARFSLRGTRTGASVVVYAGPDPADEEIARLRSAITTTAHELRGPVTVLGGIAEVLAPGEDTLDPARRAAMVASVGRQAARLDSLTADLLTAAEARRGVLDVRLEPLDLVDTLETILEAHPDVALHVLAREGSAAPLRVRADPGRLDQMVTNLLGNARKYGAPPVVVTVGEQGSWAHLAVEDQGSGVPESFRDQLFEEFSRAPGASARGTGLGLFVVRRLALAHGGDVHHRNGADRGSVFTVTLPLLGEG
ncbi:response regulator [Nocardioides sp. AX2bis]|uniref:response regulator n=1 Tax=Nocardioides sp. AX2bis TaxID=2653157 RepID=UPI0012F3B312|nr:response regulator [Nocardioides sp. AX2bis]VXC28324.1 His Kinase A (Phospho-acceptor) domain-containing protein [Nocardioides sp. AX2bis]